MIAKVFVDRQLAVESQAAGSKERVFRCVRVGNEQVYYVSATAPGDARKRLSEFVGDEVVAEGAAKKEVGPSPLERALAKMPVEELLELRKLLG